jgi:hypothetical protein
MNETPLAAQRAASSGVIGREAFWRSISPRQNLAKPAVVPDTATAILTAGCALTKASVTAAVSGATVLDPSALIEPSRGDSLVEQAAPIVRHATATRILTCMMATLAS